jgi:hypothetical protein
MASIHARLEKFKQDPAGIIDPQTVERACLAVGHRWRERALDPVSTMRAFAVQISRGNTAISHVVRLMGQTGMGFGESAYCQARARLPVAVVRAVLDESVARARTKARGDRGLWHGHRTALIDGSNVNAPDTAALRETFGVSSNCAAGAGLPMIHTLTLFDAHDGLLLDLHAAPAHTQELRHAHDLHPALRPGDVLVGDRGLNSYVHLHQLAAAGCHGVFRVSSSWKIDFPAPAGERPRHTYNRHRRRGPILVELISPDDQLIEILKPHNRPGHLSPEEFAKIPARMIVRAVRYTVSGKGLRTREIALLTTLVDAKKYPAADLAQLYLMRWRVETNLRHLKRTMGMDRLKCRSADGVRRELLMFALIYNAVCHVRAGAALARGIEPTRISFVDTLRAMLTAGPILTARIADPLGLKTWPTRAPRTHPRTLKRLHSHFLVMQRPRAAAIRWLESRKDTK